MARQTITRERKMVKSISLPIWMVEWIVNRRSFDLSKFVQLKLKELIDEVKLEEIDGNKTRK